MDLALNTNHDLVITGRDLTPLLGATLVGQRVKQGLLLLKGEWFLDEEAGLPWFDRVFKKQQNLEAIKQLLIRAISTTDGVEELQAFSLELNTTTRSLACSFTIKAGGEVVTVAEVL